MSFSGGEVAAMVLGWTGVVVLAFFVVGRLEPFHAEPVTARFGKPEPVPLPFIPLHPWNDGAQMSESIERTIHAMRFMKARFCTEGDLVFILHPDRGAEVGHEITARGFSGVGSQRRIMDPGFVGWFQGVPIIVREDCAPTRVYLVEDSEAL